MSDVQEYSPWDAVVDVEGEEEIAAKLADGWTMIYQSSDDCAMMLPPEGVRAMNDKGLWVCPNCASTSWEPADTTSMQCQCQYWPPVWTSMVQDWHRAPSGWISVEDELPKDTKPVSVWMVCPTAIDPRGVWAMDVYGYRGWMREPMHCKYTHWQPGPSAPETESDE